MATQSRIGWRPYVTQVVNAVDADATAFIAAAGITNLTQAAAISTLVNDLKTYGLWTKMKALYPMVGGSATSHKFNLKDPRDLDAAYRLVFNGGWTHTSTGALPNGTTGYANTKLNPRTALGATSAHFSYYSRNATTSTSSNYVMGADDASGFSAIILRNQRKFFRYTINNSAFEDAEYLTTSSTSGFFIGTQDGTNVKLFRNNTNIAQNTATDPRQEKVNLPIFIGADNNNGSAADYTTAESAFASIGDGLTDTEATNFYNSVQKFQTTLGRQIGAPIVSDTDAQAFINAAGLTDLGQANAVNTLVTDLKAAGVWTKMKALYPFVGGTATTHKWNLKDPRDLNEAFRLVFTGGWTHTSTGALPNGTTGYGNTFLVPSTSLSLDSTHISGYLRTNNAVDAPILSSENATTYNNGLYIWPKQVSFGYSVRINDNTSQSGGASTDDIRGFHLATRTASNVKKYILNTTQKFSVTTTSIALNTSNMYIAKSINNANYFNNQIAFISIGNGLSDTEATNFYTAVQKYQTSLSRQIGTPVLADGQTAGLLETYSGAAAAYSLRKLRTGYVGNAIRVRRSSDNVEQDIAFKTNGTLDTTSLLAFVGSGDGFVTTWYDQSGNGLHFAQSTATNQPSVVINGVVVLTLGEPAVRFNSVNKNYLEIPSSTSYFNFLHNGTDSTVISVGRYNFVTNPGTDSTLISNGGAGSGTVGTWVGFSDTSPYNNSFGAYISRGVAGIGDNATHTAVSLVNDTALPYAKQNLHFVNINASAAAIDRIKVQYDNNTIAKNNIRSNTPSTANATNNMMMGMYIQSGVKYSSLEGDVQELIIYNSNQDTNRTGIKNNINSFYSIY